jgi:hypothetical protein
MSIDMVAFVNDVAVAITTAILLLGMYRAIEMRRIFVNLAYRSRATWSSFFMLIILIQQLSGLISFPSSGVLSVIGSLPTGAFLLTMVAYADRSVLVAMETDFFHRNTLGWIRVRWPIALVLIFSLVGGVASYTIAIPNAQSPLWYVVVGNTWFVVVAAVLAYAAAALIVGARRSSDRNLRRSVLLLGLVISTLVLSIVLSIPFSEGLSYAIVYQGSGVVGIFLLYKSMMALSPISKIENVVGVTTNSGESELVPSARA